MRRCLSSRRCLSKSSSCQKGRDSNSGNRCAGWREPTVSCLPPIVSDSQLLTSYCVAYSWLEINGRQAVSSGLIDKRTLNGSLEPFRELGLHKAVVDQHEGIFATLARLRFLVKLHKPGLKLRRVEVDTSSPFGNVSSWVATILNNVCVKLLNNNLRN